MAQLARAGTTVRQLAAQFSLDGGTVRTYLYRGGLTPWELREIAGKRSGGRRGSIQEPLRRPRLGDIPTSHKGRP